MVSVFKALEQQALRHSQQVVDPTQLREALGQLPGNKFSVGERLCQALCADATAQVFAISTTSPL